MPKKSSQFVKCITVEPAFCLYTLVFVIVDTTYTNLLLQKACRLNCTSEPDLSTPCDDEKRGIILASEFNSFYRLGMFFLCTIYSMLALSWSDSAGRRRRSLFLLPIVGLIFQSLLGCLHSYFWTWLPLTGGLMNIAFEVMTGGIVVMTATSNTYICDVTNLKNRTMRLGFLSAARTFGDLVGFGSSGFILRSLGFFNTFLLCALLSSVCLVLALMFVNDISVPVDKKPHFCQMFNLIRILVENTKVVYKKSLGQRRVVVSTLFVIYMLLFFTSQGEGSVQYLFLRYKFHWDERDYSSYVIYKYIGVIIGNIFCSAILSKMLEVHDGLIGVFAGSWDLLAALGYLLASQNWHLYIIPIFDIFHGAALTTSTAFYTKYYTSDEYGRLNSFLGIFGLMIPICYPTYHEIFQRTLDTFPSACFILSIILDVFVIILYCYSYFLSRKLPYQKPKEKEEVLMMAPL
ncbi:probable peptidoglycan muropeptide transporter SLC46 [Planococcus citri]|uniref:probable peptidoglycan muropeptide transporter SLC46 n=1 Tax=Planococcus citri TaxID=170843 RepID=UPI0031F78035